MDSEGYNVQNTPPIDWPTIHQPEWLKVCNCNFIYFIRNIFF